MRGSVTGWVSSPQKDWQQPEDPRSRGGGELGRQGVSHFGFSDLTSVLFFGGLRPSGQKALEKADLNFLSVLRDGDLLAGSILQPSPRTQASSPSAVARWRAGRGVPRPWGCAGVAGGHTGPHSTLRGYGTGHCEARLLIFVDSKPPDPHPQPNKRKCWAFL